MWVKSSTGSGPGSPRGQPAWGGGYDLVAYCKDRHCRQMYHPVAIAPGSDLVFAARLLGATFTIRLGQAEEALESHRHTRRGSWLCAHEPPSWSCIRRQDRLAIWVGSRQVDLKFEALPVP